jgi:hypothetical protein
MKENHICYSQFFPSLFQVQNYCGLIIEDVLRRNGFDQSNADELFISLISKYLSFSASSLWANDKI